MNEDELTENDRKHIRRLQRVRESGDVNMFTELKKGLQLHYNPAKAEATFEWTKENFDYFESGDWVDVEFPDADEVEA